MTATEARTDWETVIGLEVHVELATATKMFCGCPNTFGSEPNTNVCPVCLGLPGSLPVVNERAVELAAALGLALGCDVRPSVFARKNYFYPDMPKDYQISQYDRPLNAEGELALPSGKRIGITRAHLEEDTGKSTHVGDSGRIHGAEASLIDYNRAGVPLLEIVSEPDIRSSEEASRVRHRAAIDHPRRRGVGRQDGGGLDAGRRQRLGPPSRRSLRHAPRSRTSTRCGRSAAPSSTRSRGRSTGWRRARPSCRKPGTGTRRGRTLRGGARRMPTTTGTSRSPISCRSIPRGAWLDELRGAIPALPAARRAVLAEAAGVGLTEAAVALLVQRDQDALALAAIEAGADAGRVLTHVEHDIAAEASSSFDPAALAAVVTLEGERKLTATQAKKVLEVIADRGGAADPVAIAADLGFEAMESGELETLVDEAIAENPDAWAKILDGNDKAAGAITGHVMRATKGKADGRAVAEILAARKAAASA